MYCRLRGYSAMKRMPTFLSQMATRVMMMSSQTTNRVLMVKPKAFGCNPETLCDNAFQHSSNLQDNQSIQAKAFVEFNKLSSVLQYHGIEVYEEMDTSETPDAIFPNNWISFHSNLPGMSCPAIIVYPMMSPIRRLERQSQVIKKWAETLNAKVIDFTSFEATHQYLEGTGSMVLDHINKITYASLSSRTHHDLVNHFCKTTGYSPVVFNASQTINGSLTPIYHTNVLMNIGEKFAIICAECISDTSERNIVTKSLEESGRTPIFITEVQMNHFLGNALELHNADQKKLLVMSTRAYNSLQQWQKDIILKSAEIIHSPIDTIEHVGGGGVRCMLAEIFPPV